MSDMPGVKRLYKSRTDRMIDGVCGGIAKYFNLDATLVRIAWVLLTLLGGSGILLYIVAMIVMPKEPYTVPLSGSPSGPPSPASSRKNSLFWGILLIGIGVALFLDNMGFPFWHWWSFDKDLFLSIFLILIGVAFLWGGRNSLTNAAAEQQGQAGAPGFAAATEPGTTPRKLYRSFTDSKVFGVCGGLAEYFSVDSAIMRILFVAGVFATGGLLVLAYIILAIVVPKAVPSFKSV